MFRKVLVANRGEIAVRVIRSLQEMGVASVAVYSDADVRALHVRLADEARRVGAAAAAESYLDVDAIVVAALESGADAVHPGYGFLSENPRLPEALAAAGVAFIGPPAEVLARVADKTRARDLMARTGIPVVPGSERAAATPADLAARAAEVGYPVLVKAASGGGGKGLRVVRAPADLPRALEEASREAAAAFGDGAVYVEKRLDRPRHVEVQILADAYGHIVHLFDRECSIQRRHQKIVEECPCPALNDELRERVCATALRAARAAGYVNAGTVELLLDRSGSFYFLEVNARLQVEHPVTELVTGLDLVKLQVEIAAGAALPFEQCDVVRHGHAIECRIYAEDATLGFVPSPGAIALLAAPAGPGVRFDEGVRSGSEVPPHYDPILAKLAVWGPDRRSAVARMARALRETVVHGVATPAELLLDLVTSDAFGRGETHTGVVDDLLETWAPDAAADDLAVIATAVRELLDGGRVGAAGRPRTGGSAGWRTPWESLGPWERAARGR